MRAGATAGTGSKAGRPGAYTLIELMVAVSIAGVLASVAGQNYFAYVHKARVARTVADIKNISTMIDGLAVDEGELPDSLGDLDQVPSEDAWGNPYAYQRIEGAVTKKGKGSTPVRRDRFLVPLNTDYDLYSVGVDGLTHLFLSAPESADDVVRANDGSYIGLGAHY